MKIQYKEIDNVLKFLNEHGSVANNNGKTTYSMPFALVKHHDGNIYQDDLPITDTEPPTGIVMKEDKESIYSEDLMKSLNTKNRDWQFYTMINGTQHHIGTIYGTNITVWEEIKSNQYYQEGNTWAKPF